MHKLIQPVAPTVDDPIELLLACHDKIRRFTALTLKLRDHLAKCGPGTAIDAQAREAAQAILRYFNQAAPLHHDDEEQDLFPALKQLGQTTLTAHIARLAAKHTELTRLWQDVQHWLLATAAGEHYPAPDTLNEFAGHYDAHAQSEETNVYPGAAQLTPSQVLQIAAAMVARRTKATTTCPGG